MKVILLLDDDPNHLLELHQTLEDAGYSPISCLDVNAAVAELRKQIPDFAIVDLFLSGDSGDFLSNDFIELILVPAQIPYGRMSSAPGLVPKEFAGHFVYDKRKFRADRAAFLAQLDKTLAEIDAP